MASFWHVYSFIFYSSCGSWANQNLLQYFLALLDDYNYTYYKKAELIVKLVESFEAE